MKKIVENKFFLFFILLLLAIGFYWLHTIHPKVQDDYAYAFIYGENSDIIRPTSERITSLRDIFRSQWNHYLFVNGRWFAHVLVQLFCGIFGKGYFNVGSALVFVLFCLVFNRLVNVRLSFFYLIFPFFLLLYCLPYIGQTVFWVAGGVNYFWATTFSLLFICVYFYYKPERNINCIDLLLGVYALCIAWMNESISIPVAGSIFFYILINYKDTTRQQKFWFVMYALGGALIVFAPGTFARINAQSDIKTTSTVYYFIFSRTYRFLWSCLHIGNFVGVFVLFITLYLLWFRNQYRKVVQNEMFFIILYFTNILFLWLLGMTEERIYFFFVICSWILFIRYISYMDFFKKTNIYLGVIILLVCIPQYIHAYNKIKEARNYDDKIIQKINNSSEDCFLIQETYQGIDNKFAYVTELSDDILKQNRVKSFYFNKRYIAAWPEDLYLLVTDSARRSMLHFKPANNKLIQYTNILNKYYLFRVPKVNQKVQVTLFKKNYKENEFSQVQKIKKLIGVLNENTTMVKKYEKAGVPLDEYAYFYIPYKPVDSLAVKFSTFFK